MSTIDDLVIGIGIDDAGLDQEAEKAASAFEKHIGKIGLATAAAGAGLEAFARGQQDSNIQTQQLAASLGISEDAMRDMARETANVGFPLNEVLDLMETGKQQGLKSKAALEQYANFWDMIGDASGESATELGKAGVSLHTMGIEAGNEGEALAALGYIQDKTTLSQSDFLGMLGKLGPDLKKTGLDVNDTAALLGVMSNEMGLTGRAARTELAKGLKESDGNFSDLLDNLGITETQFDGYADAVENSGDVMKRNADIVDDNFTPLQKLQNEAKELMYQYGDLANAAGVAAPILMSIGPIAKGASQSFGMMSKATKGLNAAMKANPILFIIGLIALLVGALIYAYNHSETFRKIVDGAFRAIGAAATWLWTNAIQPAFKAIAAIATWLWQNIIKPYFTAIGTIIMWVVNRVKTSIAFWRAAFSAIGALISAWWSKTKDRFNSIVDFVRSIPGKFRAGLSKLASVITAPFRAGFNAVARLWNNTVGQLSFTIPSWVPGLGGKGWSAPQLPTFHEGGIVGGPRGAEVLGVLQGGERVLPLGSEDAGGGRLTIDSAGSRIDDAIVEIIARAVRRRGPAAIGIRVKAA
jgi:hypothetical protein